MIIEKQYNILYKTTCLITKNFYIGAHSTNNLSDGYLGSGLHIKRSIKKYGKQNHIFEIIEFFESKKLLMDKEKEIVDIVLLENEKCMNICFGGSGGDIVNRNSERYFSYKKNMSEKYKGKTHYHYGSIWITNGNKNNRIKKDTIIPEGWYIGFTISYINNQKTIWINDGTIEKRVDKFYVLENGWKYGRCVTQKVFIYKNCKNKRILKNKLEDYLLDGWKIGSYRNSENESKPLVKMINDGIKNIYIKVCDLEKFLNEHKEYTMGSCKKSKTNSF